MALRFLAEDPWDRLAALREAVPNICLQMLLRGRNTVGYTPYSIEVTDAFVYEAATTGIDIFRIFDALNDVEQMAPAIEAERGTGTALAEVALCYTGDLSNPNETLYTLDYYLKLAERIVEAGAHVLAIKDMSERACYEHLLHAPWSPLCANASTSPCICTPTTPQAGNWPRCSPRSMPASTRSTRPRRPSGHHKPAITFFLGRRDRPHVTCDSTGAAGSVRHRAVLGGDACALRAPDVGLQ